MVLIKNLKCLHCFLLGTFVLEKVFGDVLYRKLAYLTIKTSILKSRKICVFPKGLLHGFGQKFHIALFLFREIWPINNVWRLSR